MFAPRSVWERCRWATPAQRQRWGIDNGDPAGVSPGPTVRRPRICPALPLDRGGGLLDLLGRRACAGTGRKRWEPPLLQVVTDERPSMPTLHIEHTALDFDAWKGAFD